MMLRRTRNLGFTLLELMIALGLLGALLAVAWALLGTFRDAEMRGWKLSFRTQTIRSARNWLEGDLQHLIVDSVLKQPVSPIHSRPTTPAIHATFHGDETGFSATISPSIDPIPFLGNLMSDVSDGTSGNAVDELAVGTDIRDDAFPASIWPADSVEIEYALVPMDSKTIASTGATDGLADQTQYALVRREQLGGSGPSSIDLPSERVLNAQDLYRQEGDERSAKATPMSETRLEGLLRPQFRYFDGMTWSKQWDSSQRGSVPRAIAFGFDFPAAKDLVHPSEREPSSETEFDRLNANESTMASSLNAPQQSFEQVTERTAGDNQGFMITSTNEVQLVIYISGSVGSSPAVSNPPILNVIPRGQLR